MTQQRVSGFEIGDNNVLREYCTIHRGRKEGTNARVESNNLLMVGSHLGHNTWLGDNVILANNVLLEVTLKSMIAFLWGEEASSINSREWDPSR